jgi:DNA-binding NarL/FixJ family response regulator
MADNKPAILVRGESHLAVELLAAAIALKHRVVTQPSSAVAEKEDIDIIVVHAKDIEGCTALAKDCKSTFPSAAIIVVGGPFDEAKFVDAIAVGAVASLPDNGSVTELFELIDSVRRGEAQCSGRVASLVFARVAALAKARQAAEPAAFTSRESDVFRLVRAGLSNKEIAQMLSLSVSTVKNHVHQVLAKMQIRSRRDAIDWDTRIHRRVELPAAARWNARSSATNGKPRSD